jgi:ribonuclease VapC
MIVDSSAIVAILKGEPEANSLSAAMEAADQIYISAATWFEASMVVDRYRDPKLSAKFDEIVSQPKFVIEPFTAEQARIARQAYRDYGKASGHPANLNFGDCFSYALARTRRESILFKGDDFPQTDLRSALKNL